MERILVPVLAGGQDIWLIIHGMQLAERIGGKVFILEIDQSECSHSDRDVVVPSRQTQRNTGGSAGGHKKEVKSEYYQVKGEFCEEVLKFCNRYRISNLVLDVTTVSRKETPVRMLQMINTLKGERSCRVELVGRK